MKNTAKRMAGASFNQVLIFVSVTLFFLYIGLRLGPAYFQNYQIKDALKQVEQVAVAKNLSKEEAQDLFIRQLQVNDIRGMDMKNLKLEKEKDKPVLTFDYETRIHIIGNIDAVIVFKNRVESE